MHGFIYDCVERRFLEVELVLLDGLARKGDFVVFEDGSVSFCCDVETCNGEPVLVVFDVGYADDADATEYERFDEESRYSTLSVSAFDARPCAIYALDGYQVLAS